MISLSPDQTARLDAYARLLLEVNTRVNLIARTISVAADPVARVWEAHLWPAVALGSVRRFAPGAKVLDLGTGGGIPGIPLAILFPETEFVLLDSIRKKTDAVASMVADLGLANARVAVGRVEEMKIAGLTHLTSRAVAPLVEQVKLTRHLKFAGRPDDDPAIVWTAPYVLLKGGDLAAERDGLRKRYPLLTVDEIDLSNLHPALATKSVVTLTPGLPAVAAG